MFILKERTLVVPQSEHSRFAGVLASLWGNEQFERPVFNFESFVKGVAFHDRGYGFIDSKPIGSVSDDIWLATQRAGIEQAAKDAVSNIVTLLHIKRLLLGSELDGANQVAQLADQHIQASLAQTEISRSAFEWADHITRWCDNLSFDFSFGRYLERALDVYPKHDSTAPVPIRFNLESDGTIHAEPWPFVVDSYQGFVVGYQLDGYPERLEPQILNFRLVR